MRLVHFAQFTHQSDCTSLLALRGLVSKMTELRFGRQLNRAGSPLSHRILSSRTAINPIVMRHLRRRSGEARSPSAITSSRMIVISSGWKRAFAGCSARKLPRGCLLPPLCLPCRGLLPSMQQAVVTAEDYPLIIFGFRGR
jgi:hypothetical protein